MRKLTFILVFYVLRCLSDHLMACTNFLDYKRSLNRWFGIYQLCSRFPCPCMESYIIGRPLLILIGTMLDVYEWDTGKFLGTNKTGQTNL